MFAPNRSRHSQDNRFAAMVTMVTASRTTGDARTGLGLSEVGWLLVGIV